MTGTPTLGVLGGMGPAASAEFLRRFTRAWPAGSDQEHPRVLLLSEPGIPDRSAALHGLAPDPTDAVRAALGQLVTWGADLLAVPCNTVFAFIYRIAAQVAVPVVDIVEETVAEACRVAPEGIWLLATSGTVTAGLYQTPAQRAGYPLLAPAPDEQARVQRAVEAAKRGDDAAAADMVEALVARLRTRRGLPVLLGCTDLAAAWRHRDPGVTVVDSLDVLVTACVRRLREQAASAPPPPGAGHPPLAQPGQPARAALPASPRPRVPPGSPAPLSLPQESLWLTEGLIPNLSLYVMELAYELHGPVDVEAMRGAVGCLVARHEVLRTSLQEREGNVWQVVAERVEPPFEFVDLSGLPPETVAAVAADRIERLKAPFDLGHPPLLRAALLRLAGQRHILALTMHHIVSDGISLGVIEDDLEALYGALRAGREPDLPGLEIQYGDFSVWQRQVVEPRLDRDLDYWAGALEGATGTTLPLDGRRPPVRRMRTGRVEVPLDEASVSALRGFAQAERVTPFMVLLAAFDIVLARWAGTDDVVVGTPVAARDVAGVQPLVGLFLNILPLRVRCRPEERFLDVVARVREVVLEGMSRQGVPFQRIVERVSPEGDLSRHPLFQIAFQVLPGGGGLDLDGVRARPLARSIAGHGPTTSEFDLAVGIKLEDSEAQCVLTYATELFDSATIERFGRQFAHVVRQALEGPERRVRELVALTETERALISGWNDTARAAPKTSVRDMVLEWIARQPAAVALRGSERQMSYGELGGRSVAVGAALAGVGLCLEDRVAVLMERSVDLFPVLLGSWRAGAGYVVLDPELPLARLEFLLSDAGVSAVVTRAGLAHLLPPGCEVPVLCIEDLGASPGVAPDPPLEARSLAYVCYTSGSTGRPKGVLLEHGAFANLVAWMVQLWGLTPSDRGAFTASPLFDASNIEIWPHLASGGTVAVADGQSPLGEELQRWLLDNGVTTTFFATPFAESLLDLSWPRTCSLRAIAAGGERLGPHRWEALPFDMYNFYGPTETTVCTTSERVPRDLPGDRLPAIGRPLANLTVNVLDPSLEPVPVGAVGELYAGGLPVARGYLGRPGLTAERFVPDPSTGGRLYATGDLVRWRPDGKLHYLGRADGQVKLHGHRIELGEIEGVLSRHAGVHQAAVVVEYLQGKPHRLLAAVVPDEGATCSAEALAALARAELPRYMVPAAIMVLDDPPRTRSDKLDRKALSRLLADLARPDTALEEPRTALERDLARLWAEELGLDRVGVTDDFFTLGGSSLPAARITRRISLELDRFVPLRQIFDTPTIAGLAEAIETAGEVDEVAEGGIVVPLAGLPAPGRPAGDGLAIYCAHALSGTVTSYLDLAAHLSSEAGALGLAVRVLGLQAPSLAGLDMPTDLDALARAHAGAVLASAGPDRVVLLGWSVGGAVALQVAAVLAECGRPADLLVLADAHLSRYASQQGLPPVPRGVPDEDAARDYLDQVGLADLLDGVPPGSRALVARTVLGLGRMLEGYRPPDHPGRVLSARISRSPVPRPEVEPGLIGSVEVLELDCGHEEMLEGPWARELAARVLAACTGAGAEAAGEEDGLR